MTKKPLILYLIRDAGGEIERRIDDKIDSIVLGLSLRYWQVKEAILNKNEKIDGVVIMDKEYYENEKNNKCIHKSRNR